MSIKTLSDIKYIFVGDIEIIRAYVGTCLVYIKPSTRR